MKNADSTGGDSAFNPEASPIEAAEQQRAIDAVKTEPKQHLPRPNLDRTRDVCLRRMRIGWRKARWHDIVVAVATCVIAVVGIGQLVVYLQMKKIMVSSGDQTNKLIGYAESQSHAAQQIADASYRNAAAAESFSKSMSIMGQLQEEQSALSWLEPVVKFDWVQMSHDNKRHVSVDVVVKYKGTADIKIAAGLKYGKPTESDWLFPTETFEFQSTSAYNGEQTIKQSAPEIEHPTSGAHLYAWGIIRYTGKGGTKPFQDVPFCQYTLASNVSKLKDLLPPRYEVPSNQSRDAYVYMRPFDDCEAHFETK
ncbi:MAG: hypothetical protein WBX38_03335 [Candidatus Sulfotelmatobacter sp.]